MGNLLLCLPFALGIITTLGLALYKSMTIRAKWNAFVNMPTASIAQAQEGAVVKIIGRICHAEPSLRAPATDRNCVFFSVRWFKWHGSVRDGSYSDHQETKRTDFLIEDATGRALVKSVDIKVLRCKQKAKGKIPDSGGHLFGTIFEEDILEVGDTVSVVGVARWDQNLDPVEEARHRYRDAPKRLTLSEQPNGPLLTLSEQPNGPLVVCYEGP